MCVCVFCSSSSPSSHLWYSKCYFHLLIFPERKMIFPLFRPILFRRVRVLSVTLDRVDLASTFPENPLISSFSFFERERDQVDQTSIVPMQTIGTNIGRPALSIVNTVYIISAVANGSQNRMSLHTHTCHRDRGLRFEFGQSRISTRRPLIVSIPWISLVKLKMEPIYY